MIIYRLKKTLIFSSAIVVLPLLFTLGSYLTAQHGTNNFHDDNLANICIVAYLFLWHAILRFMWSFYKNDRLPYNQLQLFFYFFSSYIGIIFISFGLIAYGGFENLFLIPMIAIGYGIFILITYSLFCAYSLWHFFYLRRKEKL